MGKVSNVDLQCPQCSKTLSDKRRLKIHLVTHDPTARVKCEIWSKSCKSPDSLSSHVAMLHSNQVHSCQLCQLEFPNAVYLRKHTKTMHTAMHRPRLPCKFVECAKTFLSKDHATAHFKQEHVENPVRFPCNFCPKEFKSRTNLGKHITTHTTEKPHQCAKCGRSFTQLSSLKRHLLTHQDKSARVRVTCHLCLETFLSKISLHRHVKVVHEKCKNYPCTYCDKRFSASGDLKRHIEAKHNSSGILHSCDKCGYQSCSKINLTHHVRNNHREKRYECYFCAKTFPIFAFLVHHLGRIHNLEK